MHGQTGVHQNNFVTYQPYVPQIVPLAPIVSSVPLVYQRPANNSPKHLVISPNTIRISPSHSARISPSNSFHISPQKTILHSPSHSILLPKT
jgi:hypothetical protein